MIKTAADYELGQSAKQTGGGPQEFVCGGEDLKDILHALTQQVANADQRNSHALEYMREYRTYFHIGQGYGVSESTAQRISRRVEDTLIKDKQFALPGRKALLKSDAVIEVVLIDASESPVERPKKDNGASTRGRRSAILPRAR